MYKLNFKGKKVEKLDFWDPYLSRIFAVFCHGGMAATDNLYCPCTSGGVIGKNVFKINIFEMINLS